MLSTYYVYSLETNTVVAVITGATNEACERKADEMFGTNDYGGTYSPAFGFASGLTENPDAVQVSADEAV